MDVVGFGGDVIRVLWAVDDRNLIKLAIGGWD